ncbi:VapE domain-containing protein [Prevotella sp. E2-28]|uniref:VapE domain-containing protein n=1 Tax=Prevotella sp. E2-28 TaxID=2913620 RepID=UPI001EDAADDC|nr:VapE domain-containing protein [Prevotella sp. E2-28]UKK53810.1 DUF3874 domain-containing protein [Prevotella sp. E2-28]
MNKNEVLINGGALNAPVVSALAAEQFLTENYCFRRNLLNGKVEFATKSADGHSSDYRPLTQEALNSIILRAKREDICEGSNPKTDIVEYIHSEEVCAYNPIREYLDHLPQWDGQNHVAQLFSRLPGISSEQLAFLSIWLRSSVAHWLQMNGRPIYGCAQEDRARFASFVSTTNNPHPLSDVTGSRRYICLQIPQGQYIDNSGEIDYEQLYAQVVYELREQKAPYWFNNDEVARIQQLNQEFMGEKDLAKIVEVCFRKPKEGEQVKSISCAQILEIIHEKFSSVDVTMKNRMYLGRTMKELGYEYVDHSHVAFYKAVPKKSA